MVCMDLLYLASQSETDEGAVKIVARTGNQTKAQYAFHKGILSRCKLRHCGVPLVKANFTLSAKAIEALVEYNSFIR